MPIIEGLWEIITGEDLTPAEFKNIILIINEGSTSTII